MPSDWASDAAGRIESVVATLRANTVDRLAVIVRMVVFGFVAAVMALTALLLAVVGAVRLLDTVLPRTVWLADLALGTLFVVAGLVFWAKARQGDTASTSPSTPASPADPI